MAKFDIHISTIEDIHKENMSTANERKFQDTEEVYDGIRRL